MSKPKLTKCQQKASDAFAAFLFDPNQEELVISGRPGTGKTWLTHHLLSTLPIENTMMKVLGGESIDCIELSALTNQAAEELTRQSGREAKTIHSLLGIIPLTDYKTGRQRLVNARGYAPTKNTLILIDEAGMAGKALTKKILESTPNCKRLYIGDKNQLGPVGETVSPIFDGSKPMVHLTEAVRYGGVIAELCEQLNETVETGIFKPIKEHKGIIDYVDDAQMSWEIQRTFVKGMSPSIARILAWTNADVRMYNDGIRGMHGLPDHLVEGEDVVCNNMVEVGKQRISTGKKMTITGVSDINQFMGIDCREYRTDVCGTLTVAVDYKDVSAKMKETKDKADWRTHYEYKNKFADLRPYHASTVHKAQGSTIDTVFIDLASIGQCRVPAEVARLLNTGVSRAAKRVVLYGDLPAHYKGE